MTANIWSPATSAADSDTGIINVTKFPYYVPNNGQSCTAAVQAMVADLITKPRTKLYWPSGEYRFSNPNTFGEATCAVVLSRLKNIEFLGGLETRFTCDDSGPGTPQFGFFLLERNQGLVFYSIEMDGSGIDNTTDGANRSASFLLTSFNVNSTSTNLAAPNKNIQFHDMYIHDVGGGPSVLPRNIALPAPIYTEGLVLANSRLENLPNVNHGLACPYTRNVAVINNHFEQIWSQITPRDCMAVDASVGAEAVLIQNNYVKGFLFGMKCEGENFYGPSANETRTSRRVKFDNNILEEIGHPTLLDWFGEGFYGIKINGKDCAAIENTIRARTEGVTTGGLEFGIVLQAKHDQRGFAKAHGNTISGSRYGAVHDNFVGNITQNYTSLKNNVFENNSEYGMLLQANVVAEDNDIIASGKAGLYLQYCDRTYARKNRLWDCGSVNNATISERIAIFQEQTGAVGYFEIDENDIFDSRGASAAHRGIFARASTTSTNKFKIRPGESQGLLTSEIYDTYRNSNSDTNILGTTNNAGPRRVIVTGNPSSTAPWNAMAWRVGDESILQPPVVGQPKSWKCTVAGTPGTHVSTGNL
jgi:hypothetical protein